MSEIVGLDAVKAKLAAYEQALSRRMADVVERGAREAQKLVTQGMPVKTGRAKQALSETTAVEVRRTRDGRNVYAMFGPLTKDLQKKTYYLMFVEFGTKGYEAGDSRKAGKDRRGREREQRVKRRIPARPAKPFFRTAIARLKPWLDAERKKAHALALIDMARGK